MRFLQLIIVAVLFSACSGYEPKPIAYGKAECAFCSMLVTDKKFGAEIVTEKGRYYFFDSAECMFRYMHDGKQAPYKHILVTHFGSKEGTSDAQTSYYLISKDIPSPMGAFLSAYSSEEEAKQLAQHHNGEVFTFKQMAEKYDVNLSEVLSK